MKNLVFYRCEVCGNIAIKLVDKGVPMFCCGQKMVEIKANSNDGAVEKHVPVAEVKGNAVTVKVGSVLHPMTIEHYISHIIIETNLGYKVFNLTPTDEPKVEITLSNGEEYVKSYSVCNLHGIWTDKV